MAEKVCNRCWCIGMTVFVENRRKTWKVPDSAVPEHRFVLVRSWNQQKKVPVFVRSRTVPVCRPRLLKNCSCFLRFSEDTCPLLSRAKISLKVRNALFNTSTSVFRKLEGVGEKPCVPWGCSCICFRSCSRTAPVLHNNWKFMDLFTRWTLKVRDCVFQDFHVNF